MTARMPKSEGWLSQKHKVRLLIAAIFLLAIPLVAAANFPALKSVFQPVVTQAQSMFSQSDDVFAPNELPAVATSGITSLSSSTILPEVTTFFVGSTHSLAIKDDGTLWAWGSNSDGRTGFGLTTGNQTTPLQVGTATNWTHVSASGTYSLGLRSDGTLWSWGFNGNGTTGLGTTTGTQT
ncbi:MAG: hypothetical protein FWF11_00595, partial [Coriobacteriia bacterium]|nr:hypothetical protein [Coriobacteriia bacterium]